MQEKLHGFVVLGTGGTIAGRAGEGGGDIGYQSAQLGIETLLAGIPDLAGVAIRSEQVAQIDSKDMSLETWRALALRCDAHLRDPGVAGIVITHGTDTLEETAYFLHRVLPAGKPVVLTCAMRPATSLQADGPQNIVDAMAVAATGVAGVSAVCAGRVHAATEVAKVHPWRLDAFSSGEAGPCGFVEAGTVRWVRKPEPAGDAPLLARIASALRWPRVEIVTSHAGADGRLVDAVAAQGVDGLVVASTGNGTVHRDLEAALLRARSSGIAVVRSTRCAQGQVLSHAGDELPSTPLSPVKARIALLLDLLD